VTEVSLQNISQPDDCKWCHVQAAISATEGLMDGSNRHCIYFIPNNLDAMLER